MNQTKINIAMPPTALVNLLVDAFADASIAMSEQADKETNGAKVAAYRMAANAYDHAINALFNIANCVDVVDAAQASN